MSLWYDIVAWAVWGFVVWACLWVLTHPQFSRGGYTYLHPIALFVACHFILGIGVKTSFLAALIAWFSVARQAALASEKAQVALNKQIARDAQLLRVVQELDEIKDERIHERVDVCKDLLGGDADEEVEQETRAPGRYIPDDLQGGGPKGWLGGKIAKYFGDLYFAFNIYAGCPHAVLSPAEQMEVRAAVVTHPTVMAAADVAKIPPAEFERRVGRIYDSMAARTSLRYLRVIIWIFMKCYRLLYPFGIHIKDNEIKMLKAYAARGTLVYLPTHKSHFDYIMITFICLTHGLPLPTVVSGENLNIRLIGPLLSRCGAFFIRRTFAGGDPVYPAVFNAYCRELLKRNIATECFIEGGRSRSGKLLQPKSGYLRTVVDAVVDGGVGEVFVCPIALSYDRIVENEAHIKELLGGAKKKEELLSVLAWAMQLAHSIITGRLCFGSVDVGFAEPVSVGKFIRDDITVKGVEGLPVGWKDTMRTPRMLSVPVSQELNDVSSEGSATSQVQPNASPGSAAFIGHPASAAIPIKQQSSSKISMDVFSSSPCNSALGIGSTPRNVHDTGELNLPELNTDAPIPNLSKDRRKGLATSLGFRVLWECNRVSSVLPSALISTIMLSHYGRGLKQTDLIKRTKLLRAEVKERDGRVVRRENMTLEEAIGKVVERVLGSRTSHNRLVKRHKDVIMVSLYSPEERMELATYRNQLIHHFTDEAMILCAFYHLEKATKEFPVSVSYDALLEGTRFMSSLLRFEFIFRASRDIRVTFLDAVQRLVNRGVLIASDGITINTEFDNTELADTKGTEMYLFLCALLWPFIDSYFMCCLGLYRLLRDDTVLRNDLIHDVQDIGEMLYFEGPLDLYEAVSKETIENALELFKSWKILKSVDFVQEGTGGKGGQTIKSYQLHPEHRTEEAIDNLAAKIGAYKKRSRQYRSRRYMGTTINDLVEAKRLVKQKYGLWLPEPQHNPDVDDEKLTRAMEAIDAEARERKMQ